MDLLACVAVDVFDTVLIGFFVTWNDPPAGSLLVPGIDRVINDIRTGREWWTSINDDGRAASAALITTNNIRVAILAFQRRAFHLLYLPFYAPRRQNGDAGNDYHQCEVQHNTTGFNSCAVFSSADDNAANSCTERCSKLTDDLQR